MGNQWLVLAIILAVLGAPDLSIIVLAIALWDYAW
jgi:hypothetical protein